MNDVVEAANKKLEEDYPEDDCCIQRLAEMLPWALLAYRSSIHTSTRATPYSLVYGIEIVLLVEVEIPSLRILVELGLEA